MKVVFWKGLKWKHTPETDYKGRVEGDKSYSFHVIAEYSDMYSSKVGYVRHYRYNAEINKLYDPITPDSGVWYIEESCIDEFSNVAEAMQWCKDTYMELVK